LKDVHERLLFEMMSNSRRSDRDLARTLRVSQPTITRTRRWLEMNGFIMEYTLIPHFGKAGFELMAFTFIKMHVNGGKAGYEELKNRVQAFFDDHPNLLMACRGEGMNCDGIIVSLHRNFVEFTEYVRELKMDVSDAEVVGSFLASLEEANKLRCLTLKRLKFHAKTEAKTV